MNLKLWVCCLLLAVLVIAAVGSASNGNEAFPAYTTEQRLLASINQEQVKQTRLLEDIRYELRRLNRK